MPTRLAVLLLAVATPLAAQRSGPPDSLVNVRVIPRDTPVRDVINQMGGITRALGVRCTFCHVGDESMNIWDYDFVSDEKPTKLKAREMMRMVQAINGEFLPRLDGLDAQGLEVTCMTCHRGVSLPQPLSQVLLRAHADGGMTAMDSTYEALKERYYGRASYDFGEVTLDDVASRLFSSGSRDDAIRTYVKNAELFTSSSFAQRRLGQARLEVGDTAGAIEAFRRTLAVNPRDRTATQALQQLGASP